MEKQYAVFTIVAGREDSIETYQQYLPLELKDDVGKLWLEMAINQDFSDKDGHSYFEEYLNQMIDDNDNIGDIMASVIEQFGYEVYGMYAFNPLLDPYMETLFIPTDGHSEVLGNVFEEGELYKKIRITIENYKFDYLITKYS